MKKNLMKYAALAALAAATSFTACDKDENSNSTETPTSWESSKFGTVSFATDSIWRVGNQEWSDAVQATGCNKTDYNGYDTIANEFCADCRSNPTQKGDLFSWVAVAESKNNLCPEGWRVPTRDDFRALDIALGGTGEERNDLACINEKYLNPAVWGGHCGDYCMPDGAIVDDLMVRTDTVHLGTYWTQIEHSTDWGFSILLSPMPLSTVSPQTRANKGLGQTLRCVRDVQ